MDDLVIRRYFDHLIGAHEGRPAIVLCGGPSTPEQFEDVYKRIEHRDPVLIGVNEHGSKLAQMHYTVSLDNIPKKLEGVHDDTLKLAPYAWADVKLTGYWNSANSGRTAVWVAWRMGCTPIIVCGCDMYQNRRAYFHDPAAQTAGYNQTFEQHVREWSVVPNRVPAEILTAAGGPLVSEGVMPKFDGRRKYPQVDFRPEKARDNGAEPLADGLKIRILRNTFAEGVHFDKGETPIVRERTARQLIRARKAAML